mmetsp:Transcript_25115/g.63691  ORF Transcript_25115/g.63691 Transcript_25115/m.63691 type:complete len:200 (+) Transcript_25115:1182-1781(+)
MLCLCASGPNSSRCGMVTEGRLVGSLGKWGGCRRGRCDSGRLPPLLALGRPGSPHSSPSDPSDDSTPDPPPCLPLPLSTDCLYAAGSEEGSRTHAPNLPGGTPGSSMLSREGTWLPLLPPPPCLRARARSTSSSSSPLLPAGWPPPLLPLSPLPRAPVAPSVRTVRCEIVTRGACVCISRGSPAAYRAAICAWAHGCME